MKRICADDISIVSIVGRRQVCGWHFAIDCLTNNKRSRRATVSGIPLLLRQLINTRKRKRVTNPLLLPSLFRFELVVNESCRGKLGKTARFLEKGRGKTLFTSSRPFDDEKGRASFRRIEISLLFYVGSDREEEEEKEEERKIAITISRAG